MHPQRCSMSRACLCPPWTLALLLPLVSMASARTVVGWVGQPVTLPCGYAVKKESDINSICWGREYCPSSKCSDPIVTTEGRKISWKKSNRYALRGQIHQGDVSLTILDATDTDRGTYCCRVEVPGWFNDLKYTIVLQMNKAPRTTPRKTIPTTTLTTTPMTTTTWTMAPTSNPMTTPKTIPTMAPTTMTTTAPRTAPTTASTTIPTTALTMAPTSAPTTAPIPTTTPSIIPLIACTTRPITTPTAAPATAFTTRLGIPTPVLRATTSATRTVPTTALRHTPVAPTTAALMTHAVRTAPTTTDMTPSTVTSPPTKKPTTAHTSRSTTAARLLPPAETTGTLLAADTDTPLTPSGRESSVARTEDAIPAETTWSKTDKFPPGDQMNRKGTSPLSTPSLIAVVCGSVAFCLLMLLLGLSVKGKILKSCHVDKKQRFGTEGNPTELLNRAPLEDKEEAETLFTL